jgi:site-specific recombinase
MFVLNLGVSFAVASFVALRAYDVGRQERLSILRDVLKQIVQSPLRFLYPVEIKRPDAQAAEPLTLAPADQPAKDTTSLPS